MTKSPGILRAFALVVALLHVGVEAEATMAPRLSFEEIVARSAVIARGRVVRSWTAWDDARAAIWTHYEIRVAASFKGDPAKSTLVISEPGGEADGVHMQILGAPRYEPDEDVYVFATDTPIGYRRTCGWGQGRFVVSAGPDGARVRSDVGSVSLVEQPVKAKAAARKQTPLAQVDGLSVAEFELRVRAAVAAAEAR